MSAHVQRRRKFVSHTGIRVVFVVGVLGSGVLLEVFVLDFGKGNHDVGCVLRGD